jgi:predicted O-methyltransferase YrrM
VTSDVRGWEVLPAFIGEKFLSQEIFDELQRHPFLPGESAWGTRNLLHAIILSTRPKIVLEVGSHIGSGSLVIGAALRANGFGKSYHLEPQDHYYQVLKDFINRAGLADYAYPLQMFSTDPVLPAMIGKQADLIFLDANHSYSHAFQDLLICESMLSSQGLVLLDDVGNPHSGQIDEEGRGGVRQALIDFASGRPDFSVIFLEPPFWLNPCGLAILARKPSDEQARAAFERFVG